MGRRPRPRRSSGSRSRSSSADSVTGLRAPGSRSRSLSLYFAAGLFALAAGIVDAAHPISHRNSGGVVIQAVMGVWWGITFAGYLPLLWPLAYFTHSLLGRSDTPLPRAVGVPGASATEAREPLLTHARLEDTPPRTTWSA